LFYKRGACGLLFSLADQLARQILPPDVAEWTENAGRVTKIVSDKGRHDAFRRFCCKAIIESGVKWPGTALAIGNAWHEAIPNTEYLPQYTLPLENHHEIDENC
jgi:hypothetical protein